MHIEFKTQTLEKLVNNFQKLSKKFGTGNAENIIKALNALSAAKNPFELPRSYHFHKLKGAYKNTFAIDVDPSGKRGKERILFQPTNNYETAIKNIQNICIVKIFEDYHK